MSYEDIEQIPPLIKQLYLIVNKLESIYKGRKFTLDGHLLGSIGEVVASYYYDLELLTASAKTHDAITKDNKQVQIKSTQGNRIGIREQPEYLIVIKILGDGSIEEVYNGPGDLAWNNSGEMQKNGQRSISINTLKRLMNNIPKALRIPKIR